MKIDFIIGSLRAGGAERVVSTLANHFAENNHDVRILTFKEGDNYELHPKVQRINGPHQQAIFNYALVRGLIFMLKFYRNRENRPDIISSHVDLMGLATIPISRFYRIKLTVSEHFNHFNKKMTVSKWILWNFLYQFPEALTVLTKFDLPFFKNKTKHVEVMFNPCSFLPIKSLNGPREKVILAVGDLNRYKHKGFDNLLDIAADVLPDHPEWKLMIVGQGKEGLEFLSNKSSDLHIEKQVIFTGFRSDVKDLMAKSEIFILSSRHEGLPLVLIEAMSQGMACIAYDCISGPSEIISHKVDGILIDNQNKKEMSLELKELILNSELRESIRLRTPESLNKFSINQIGKQWKKLFDTILLK